MNSREDRLVTSLVRACKCRAEPERARHSSATRRPDASIRWSAGTLLSSSLGHYQHCQLVKYASTLQEMPHFMLEKIPLDGAGRLSAKFRQ